MCEAHVHLRFICSFRQGCKSAECTAEGSDSSGVFQWVIYVSWEEKFLQLSLMPWSKLIWVLTGLSIFGEQRGTFMISIHWQPWLKNPTHPVRDPRHWEQFKPQVGVCVDLWKHSLPEGTGCAPGIFHIYCTLQVLLLLLEIIFIFLLPRSMTWKYLWEGVM